MAMLTRSQVASALLDHMTREELDTKYLSDRDILELILHALIEKKRAEINKITVPSDTPLG